MLRILHTLVPFSYTWSVKYIIEGLVFTNMMSEMWELEFLLYESTGNIHKPFEM